MSDTAEYFLIMFSVIVPSCLIHVCLFRRNFRQKRYIAITFWRAVAKQGYPTDPALRKSQRLSAKQNHISASATDRLPEIL